jgi:hypothetical protein
MEEKPIKKQLIPSQYIPLILTFCSISALFIYLIYSQNLVFGSTLGQWTFPYFQNMIRPPFWIPLLLFVLTGVLIYLGSKLINKHEAVTLIGGFIIAIAIQILFQQIYQYPMDVLIRSNDDTSFYTVASQYSPADILSHYQTLAPTFIGHARSNMPGKIFFFEFLSLFTTSPQVMGYLIIAISTFGGLLLYGISKRLFQDKTVALYAFVLYTLLPCKQDFFPILNTVTPVFILLSLYLLIVYLDSKNILYLILLGISLYALVLFDPSPLVTGILFVGIILFALIQKKISIKNLIAIIGIPVLSFAAIYLLFYAIFSYTLWQSLHFVFLDASDFNVRANRQYTLWLRENVKEFFYGAGLPVMMIFIYSIFTFLSQVKEEIKNISHWAVENIYLVSLTLTFLIVLFLGINRGEVTRLWIYLAVFFQIPVAVFMAKKVKSNTLFFVVAGTLIVQNIITLMKVGFIIP